MGYRQNASEITTNYTDTLSKFVNDLKYEDIPSEVIERAKMIVLHTIGAALASKDHPMAEQAVRLGKLAGVGGPQATLWTDGSKVSMISAALANGTLSDILNWEDCSWTGHPSAAAVPVALAVAEAQKRSGKEFLTAVVLAYECYQRIAMVVQPPEDWNINNGWGLICWQIFAGMVPAAKFAELSDERMNQAFGFGATACPIPSNLHEVTMSDECHFEYGMRAKDGILCAMCAKAGVDNYMDCFDDPWSFELHMTSSNRPDWYTKDLGKRWLTMETMLKHWPANMYLQNTMEITSDLIQQHGISADRVEEVVVDPPVAQCMEVNAEGFTSVQQAQFSVPFMLASLILDPVPGAQWFEEKKLTDSNVLDLAARVHPGKSAANDILQLFRDFQEGNTPETTVTIRTVDGKEYSQSMQYHPGHPKNMFSREELKRSFHVQTRKVLTAEKADKIAEAFLNIDQYNDVADAVELLMN